MLRLLLTCSSIKEVYALRSYPLDPPGKGRPSLAMERVIAAAQVVFLSMQVHQSIMTKPTKALTK